MDEFKRLTWPVADIGTDLKEAYTLDLPDYRKANPFDVFFCHLMEIDPLHYPHIHQKSQQSNESDGKELAPKQFIDPRTGIEIPTHKCNYQNYRLEVRNIFLSTYVQMSKIKKHEHAACLRAIRSLAKTSTEQSMENKKDALLYETTSIHRLEEKSAYLEKLREHYFTTLSTRFHAVPASIAMHIWKKQCVEMQRYMANKKYRLRTAVTLQSADGNVKTDVVHQEHMGNVTKMTAEIIEYLRQSYPKLIDAYNIRKNKQLQPSIKRKCNELIRDHEVDFVVPISILKRILSNRKNWHILMSVKESEQNTIFNPKKEIWLKKPLPPTNLNGNERQTKGAKYLLRSCLNGNASHTYSHADRMEHKMANEKDTVEYDCVPKTELQYKVTKFDEFCKEHQKVEISQENMSFAIFNLTDCDETNESVNILVPSKQVGYKTDANGEVQLVNYSPKIEFQAEYGAEVMTKDELMREWCDLYFRPNSVTERFRFDCLNGMVINRQTINLVDLEDELKSRFDVEPQQLLRKLLHALRTFGDFPVGDYLLQNNSKQFDFVKIYEQTNESESLAVSEIIKEVTFNVNIFEKPDWQPIDDKIVTEIHEKYQILPCAFPHKEYLDAHNVKPAKDGRNKYTKAAAIANKVRKIKPRNDSIGIVQRSLAKRDKEAQRKSVINMHNKQNKKSRNRERRRARNEANKQAQKTETDEWEAAKQLLTATMDQYETLNGTPV